MNIHIFECHLDLYDNTDNSRCLKLLIIFKKINLIKNNNNILLLVDFNLLNKYQLNENEWNYIKRHDPLRNIDTKSIAITPTDI